MSRVTKKKIGGVGVGELFLGGSKVTQGGKIEKCSDCFKSGVILFVSVNAFIKCIVCPISDLSF